MEYVVIFIVIMIFLLIRSTRSKHEDAAQKARFHNEVPVYFASDQAETPLFYDPATNLVYSSDVHAGSWAMLQPKSTLVYDRAHALDPSRFPYPITPELFDRAHAYLAIFDY